MPHLVILYTPGLDRPASEGGTDMSALCRTLADTMLAARDDAGKPVFPTGGTRVLAYPAAHCAVADGGAAGMAAGGDGHYDFVYMNVRMARGRTPSVHLRVGQALEAAAKAHFAQHLAQRHIGITVQVDEGHEVFDARNSSIHPLFNKS
jgi:5-carboxymethyl-2-hydroxymuconate isomerase